MKLIIERFEDALVVCKDKKGKEVICEHKKLPERATEGDVIKKTLSGKYVFDTDEDMVREHRMNKMRDNKDDGPKEAKLEI